jgi:hypothetical protein
VSRREASASFFIPPDGGLPGVPNSVAAKLRGAPSARAALASHLEQIGEKSRFSETDESPYS